MESAIEGTAVDIDCHAEAVFEPNRLEREVVTDGLELVFERDGVRGRVERAAEEPRQLRQRRLRSRRILLDDEAAKTVERVEEKVRIDLRLRRRSSAACASALSCHFSTSARRARRTN